MCLTRTSVFGEESREGSIVDSSTLTSDIQLSMPLHLPLSPPTILALLLLALLRPRRAEQEKGRERLVHPQGERVVILGASSGVGEGLALEYARRGARM